MKLIVFETWQNAKNVGRSLKRSKLKNMKMNFTAKLNVNSAQRCSIKIDFNLMRIIVLKNQNIALTVNSHLNKRYLSLILNNVEQKRGYATSVNSMWCEKMNESMKMWIVLQTFKLIFERCKMRNWKRIGKRLNENDFLKRNELSNLKMQREGKEKSRNKRKEKF